MSTRREILRALLGAPLFAAAACKRRSIEPTWSGGFVDRAEADAHKWRDGFRPAPAIGSNAEEIPVLVIGAGIAGLAAGWQLRRLGVDRFLVLEMEDEPGGTSLSGRSRVTAFPWGAHYLPAPRARNQDLVALLSESGTIVGRDDHGEPIFDEAQLCAAPKERVFFRGLWHAGLIPRAGASTEELADLARFDRAIDGFIAARDEAGRRAFAVPIADASDDPRFRALDGISMADWLEREGLRSPLVKWVAAYACRDDFGTEPEATSAWFGLHYFAARTEDPGDDSAEFLTWPAGNGFLAAHLADRIGRERIVPKLMATAVAPESDGRRARVVAWDRARAEARSFVAERVILASPSFLRGRLLSLWPGCPAYDVKTAPWLVANIHLRRPPASNGDPQAWDNVIFGSRSLGFVDATHQSARRSGGPTVWTYYLPFTAEDERAERRKLASLSWREASDAIVAELSSCHLDFAECVERIDIMRWGHGMVRPLSGTAFSPARIRAARPFGPLSFAHTDLSGMALFEEAFYHGVRAAREAADGLGLKNLSNQAR